MKKILCFIALTFMFILVTGCGKEKIESYEPTSKEDVINYVKNYIYDKTGDEVNVKIINVKQYDVCLKFSVVRCIKSTTNKNVKQYDIEISNVSDENLKVESMFLDSYKRGNDIFPRGVTNEYALLKNYSERTKEVDNLLKTSGLTYKKYKSTDGVNTDDIFITTNNSSVVKSLEINLNNIAANENYDYGYGYRLFVVKSKEIFDTLYFSNYENAKKENEKYYLRKDIVRLLTTDNDEVGYEHIKSLGSDTTFNSQKFDDESLLQDYKYGIYIVSRKGIDSTEEGFYLYGIR